MHVPRAAWVPLAALIFVRCNAGVGTEAEDAPTPEVSKCKSPRALMREFYTLLDQDQFEGLRTVMENDLLSNKSDYFQIEGTNPVFTTLAVLTHAFAEWAGDAPEAPPQLCLAAPPPNLALGNRLCRVRRLLTTLLAENKAAPLLDRMRPVLLNMLKYVEGKIPDSNGAMAEHYELIRVVHNMAYIGGKCDPANTYALLGAVIEYLTPTRAQEMLDHMRALLAHPAIRQLLTSYEHESKVGVDAYVTLVNLLVGSIRAMRPGPTYFDQTEGLINQLADFARSSTSMPDGPGLADMLQTLSHDDLKPMMHPDMGILLPMQNLVECIWAADPATPPGRTVYAALYTLFLDANVLNIPDLLDAASAIVSIDPTGEASVSLGDSLRLLSGNEDAQRAVNAILEVLLRDESDSPAPGNAKLMVPVLRVMIERKVIEELGTLVQQVLYKCDTPQ